MAVYRSLDTLESAIMRSLNSAMNAAAQKSKPAMIAEIQAYYDSGTPKIYQRTGQLKRTPNVSPISSDTNSVSFDAYLDQAGGYSTGKMPTMTDVLNLTNYGTTSSSVGPLRPAVGAPGYWERSQEKIKEIVKKSIESKFK